MQEMEPRLVGVELVLAAELLPDLVGRRLVALGHIVAPREEGAATFVLPEGAAVSEADCARALQGMPYRVAGLEKARP